MHELTENTHDCHDLRVAAGGVGGGVGVSLAVDRGTTTTTVVQSPAAATSLASTTTGSLTVNWIYRRRSRASVDIVVTTPGGRAEGSGLVIDKQGDIVTNGHVVSGATSLQVRFADGTRRPPTWSGRTLPATSR